MDVKGRSQPAGPKKHTIFINDHKYQVEADSRTGSELKSLDQVPAGNTLLLEIPGPDPDRKIDNAESVELKSGMRFYDLPPIQRGNVLDAEIERLRDWYPDVRSEIITEGRWVSAGVGVPEGWLVDDPRVGVITPGDFPANKPSGFWVTTPVRLPTGSEIGAQRRQEARDWANVCWQVQSWDPDREHLWRYFKAMERWFAEGWQ